MESNTPNSGKSPSLNTLPTPNNLSLSPSDIRVVTQTQDSKRLFDNPDSTPDHQHLHDALCPAHNVDNTPRVDTPQAPLAPTPRWILHQIEHLWLNDTCCQSHCVGPSFGIRR